MASSANFILGNARVRNTALGGFSLANRTPGLYKGYKLRNARLDALNESPPSFLASSTLPIANQDFADAESEATLRELHTYLVQKHNLLTRVIAARKTHHTHFYSETYDYGHQVGTQITMFITYF